jgi:hypothetical protein
VADLGDHDLDLPFEESPTQWVSLGDIGAPLLSGGLVVSGVVVPLEADCHPALLFRFMAPTGQFLDPILLVLDDDQVQKLPKLVADAAASASRHAKEQQP